MKKNFTSGINAFVLLVLMLTMGCDSIYIPDPIDPRLPKYTDSGNNVAGALVDDKLWKSENPYLFIFGSANPPQIYYKNNGDSLSLQFTGFIEGDDQNYTYISFGLRDTNVNSVASLSRLADRKFALGDGANMASIGVGSDCNGMGTGQIYFRSVKYNSAQDIASISGTFGFDISNPECRSARVTYGRFDMKIEYVSPF